jgi:hypothetical protein
MKIYLEHHILNQNLEDNLLNLGLQIIFSKNNYFINQFLMLRNNIMQKELKINELNFLDDVVLIASLSL